MIMEKTKQEIKKLVINLSVILLVLLIVLYFSLKDNYDEIINYISSMNIFWFLMALFVFIFHRILIAISSYNMIKINEEKVNIFKVIQINLIILFFNGVTPFSGGGQPMEVYFLHNEKIKYDKSVNVVLQNFIIYQTALVVISIFAVIYNQVFVLFPQDSFMRKLVVLGFVINFLVLLFSFVISFGKRTNKFISNKGVEILAKIKIVKDKEKMKNKLNDYINRFHENALLLTRQKKKALLLLVLNIFAIFISCTSAYFVALGMGVSNLNLLLVVVISIYVTMIGSFVPIPGGTGGLEFGFIYFFGYYITGGVLTAVMLIWRFVSYYLPMIIGAIALVLYRKKDKKCE